MRTLTDLTDGELAAAVAEAGGKAFQARQIGHWLWRHGVAGFDAMHNVPNALRKRLAECCRLRHAEVAQVDVAEDGTQKLLVRLADGEAVECVIIPDGERTTLCVSTQVGCPVACVF